MGDTEEEEGASCLSSAAATNMGGWQGEDLQASLRTLAMLSLPLEDLSLDKVAEKELVSAVSSINLAEETTLLATAPLLEHLQQLNRSHSDLERTPDSELPCNGLVPDTASSSERLNPLVPPLWPDVLASVLGHKVPSYVAGLLWRSRSLGDMHRFGFNMSSGSLLGWQDIYKVYGSSPISTDMFHEERKEHVTSLPTLTDWYDHVQKPTSELMAAIQLGIGQSITSLSLKPKRDLLLQDFTIVETVFFPREGSNLTPAHHHSDFRFKTYAPIAFRYFRELFGIQPDDFLLSLCNETLRELSNPGASGSIFYTTNDDEFIIKTVQHKEAEFLQKLLPGYYMNLNQNPRTLLPKFYGLYCYQCGGKNIRFVVMNNLLPSSVKLHEKYDLKGSTYGRKASKGERKKKTPTLKDLDYMGLNHEGIMLEAETFAALTRTIERDCRVLQSFKIMDYSLLMGVYNLDLATKERHDRKLQSTEEELQNDGAGPSIDPPDEPGISEHHNASALNRSFSRGRSVRQRIAAYSTAMEAIQAQSEPVEIDNDDVPSGGIPARNHRGERLFIYIGIIDILQSYRLKKKLEHAMKAMVHDGDTISVHRPGFYAQRFQNFFAQTVFKKVPSLDQPQIKGPHMRFRKLVHLATAMTALKHSPSKKKALTARQRSVTESDGRTTVEKSFSDRIRTQSANDETGAIGGRPDLLPQTSTPPPTFDEATSHVHSSGGSGSRITHGTRSSDIKLEVAGSGLLSSPAHSISESVSTHTEHTEDTPQSLNRNSALRNQEVTVEQVEIELNKAAKATLGSAPGSTVVATMDNKLAKQFSISEKDTADSGDQMTHL